MSQVISFAEYRNARTRDRMLTLALNGETVIVETRTGLVRAERILCLERAAQIRNSLGETFSIEYGDIREVRPASIPQISAVSDSGDWVLSSDGIGRTESGRVVAFARRGRRN